MRFLYPLFLLGALVTALPVVLHLLRRQAAPEVPFTAVHLLRRAPPEQTRRRRLRDLLLLAARIAALVLLAAAFARPYFGAGARDDDGLLIVALDRSYSMTAPGAFEKAVALARETIDAARAGERVAVIAFDDRADVISAPASAADARAALRDARSSFGSTRYGPMLARAAEVAEQRTARLVIVSDLQRSGWEGAESAAVPAGLRVELRDSGASVSNLAVTNVQRDTEAVIATIMNAGSQPAAGSVRAMVDGRQAAATAVSVPPSGSVDVRIPLRAPAQGALAVEIDDRDGYSADNVRYLVLDTDSSPRVLIVGGESDESGFYLTRAIQSATGSNRIDVRAKRASALGTLTPEEFRANGAVILLSTRSLDRKAREMLAGFVRGGGGLLVAASPEVDPSALSTIMGWSDFSAAEQSTQPVVLAATDVRHPIVRMFGSFSANLGQVRFTRIWRVRAEGWDVAAKFTNGSAALLERRLSSDSKGRVVVFASDVDRQWNDFPLHPAFVPFVLEAVRHITAAADVRRAYVVAETPRGVRPEPGVYTLAPGDRRVAVNVDARESATVRMTPEEFMAMVRPVDAIGAASGERRAQQLEGRQNLWRYGLLLMMCALVSESLLGRIR